MPTNNFLDFTKLTHTEILEQITTKLSNDPRFTNFRESAIAQMVLEIFAGTTDINNYYIERRAEESFFDTSKLQSSAILLSKQLGYVPIRPIPSKTELKLTIKGSFPVETVVGDKIIIPNSTEFLYNDKPFLTTEPYEYVFSDEDINGTVNIFSDKYEKVFTYATKTTGIKLLKTDEDISTEKFPIRAYQGEKKTNVILGANNPFVGSQFQKYRIPSTTVSNFYGENDIGDFDPSETLQDYKDNISLNLTYVAVGTDESNANLYKIERRSLMSNDVLNGNYLGDFSSPEYICLLQSSPNQEVEIVFGDGKNTRLGSMTLQENIYFGYFSTLGKVGNMIGVIGEKLKSDFEFMINDNSSGLAISDNLVFTFKTNSTGGSDIESPNSIKQNAPGIYASLDRLVTKGDYESYLKTITSPIDIKNAIAWGEQEEGGKSKVILELFNVVLYTAISSLYNLDSNVFTDKYKTGNPDSQDDISTSVLDEDYDLNETIPDNLYSLLVDKSSLDASTPSEKIKEVNDLLDGKQQITVRNIYISPIIQDFYLLGNVFVSKLTDLNKLELKINNELYTFLNDKVDFNVEVFQSNLTEIIEKFPSVSFTDIDLLTEPLPSTYNIDIFNEKYPIYGPIKTPIEKIISNYLHLVPDWYSDFTSTTYLKLRIDNPNEGEDFSHITERNLFNDCITDIKVYLESINKYDKEIFITDIVVPLRNTLTNTIRDNLMKKGKIKTNNITEFSIKNEVAKIKINLEYKYKL